MAKQQKESAKWCKWNGMRMTVNQRNILMKSDYIHGGLTTKEIAAKYEVSFNTVANLVTNGKWVQARKNFLLETQRRADEAVSTSKSASSPNYYGGSDIFLRWVAPCKCPSDRNCVPW